MPVQAARAARAHGGATGPVAEALTVKYSGIVTSVGALTADFRGQGLVIFFGEGAPEELHEFAVLHRLIITKGGICAGDEIVLAGQRLPLLAVGPVANANLIELGHLDLKANGEVIASLPGDVCVAQGELPMLRVGDVWSVEGQSPSHQPDPQSDKSNNGQEAKR